MLYFGGFLIPFERGCREAGAFLPAGLDPSRRPCVEYRGNREVLLEPRRSTIGERVDCRPDIVEPVDRFVVIRLRERVNRRLELLERIGDDLLAREREERGRPDLERVENARVFLDPARDNEPDGAATTSIEMNMIL